MDKETQKYNRFERFFEITSFLVILSIFFIIQLPLDPIPDRMTIYIVLIVSSIIILLLRKIKIPILNHSQVFIESILMVSAVSLIVHNSGGIRSYFLFLYLLPTLRVSASATFWNTFVIWIYTSILIFGEVFLFSQATVEAKLGFVSSPVSLAILFSWSIVVISGYGRYLADQLQKTQSTATLVNLEKEKSINKLKDEFLFIISHELRGPVTAIRGYLELFITSGKNITDQVKNIANLAFNESDKLADLITELLDISRLEVGKLKLQNEKFDIYVKIKEIVQKYDGEAQAKKLELSLKQKEKEIFVFTDKDRLGLVVKNLLENAIKYTTVGGKIWVWVEDKGSHVFISVADNGVGIGEKDLPHIFDRFHDTIDQSQKSELKEKNTGLGLFLAKNLVEKMGGKIFVESQREKGSKFTFTLSTAHQK